MPRRPSPVAALILAVSLAVVTGCGSDGGDPVEEQGARDRAVSELVAWGLPKDQAECVTDQLGAATVVEAPDIGILTDGASYRDAAEACIP